jgi:hypothetical protein
MSSRRLLSALSALTLLTLALAWVLWTPLRDPSAPARMGAPAAHAQAPNAEPVDAPRASDGTRRALPAPPAASAAPTRTHERGETTRDLDPRVIVVDELRQPLSGARVGLRWSPGAPSSGVIDSGFTDSAGRWSPRSPDPGNWHALERMLPELELYAALPGRWAAPLRVTPAELRARREPFVLPLVDAARVSGRVLAVGGAPVPDAYLMLVCSDCRAGPSDLGHATSDGSGAFEMIVPRGRGSVAWLLATEPGAGYAQSLEFGLAADVELDLTLDRGLCLTGRALLADGTPARDQLVEALELDAPREKFLGAGVVRTDREGLFVLARLSARTYRLGAVSWLDRERGLERPTLLAEAPARDLVVRSPYVSLRVCVRASDGTRLRGMQVSCKHVVAGAVGPMIVRSSDRRSTSGSPPEAGFALVPGERYLLQIDAEGCHPAQRMLTASDRGEEQVVELDLFGLDEVTRWRPAYAGLAAEAAGDVRVDLYDPYSLLCVRRGMGPGKDGFFASVPPGPWRMRARRSDQRARDFLEPGAGTAVELLPGSESTVALPVD